MLDKLKEIVESFLDDADNFLDVIKKATGCKDDEEAYPC